MQWKHTLTVGGLSTDIEEPIGFSEISFLIQRDDLWHGIFFEASTSQLSFYGSAYGILKEQKESYGVDALVTYTASFRCEGEIEYSDAITGNLNFSAYQESCGNDCLIKMSVEQTECAMIFKNRFDQRVNIDENIAFDKRTLLQNYTGLDFNMQLATQVIPISADASVAVAGDLFELTDDFGNVSSTTLVRPTYAIVRDNSINTGALDDPFNNYQQVDGPFLLTPQVLMEENDLCVPGDWEYNVRMKGGVKVTGVNNASATLVFGYWDGTAIIYNSIVDIEPEVVVQNPMADGVIYFFDETYTGTVALPHGVGVYAFIKIQIIGLNARTYYVNFDQETSFLLSHDKTCPPTDCKVYLINETLSRITESITDMCLRVKSEYYGRIDSEPYANDYNDGCGGLRILTTGLKVRQAVDKQFFASMKEVMDGLRGIDNIGMGIESNLLRIEPVEYFYNNTKLIDIPFIPALNTSVDSTQTFSNIKIGYNKWEIKSSKGIDEFNSTKEFRTGLKFVNNELDISSNLIAGGYIIENLRTYSLGNTGQTDSTYDNDIFIICVERDAYGYHVEQGIAQNAANFYSPSTAYNWRIRPMYNLMRWAKSIYQSYINLANTTSKLFFTSGTGNYIAEGQLPTGDPCKLENGVISENDDLSKFEFAGTDYIPIYKPEIITFEYPLSIRDYKILKDSPYGYISYQCGRGEFEKGYIKSIAYKPAQGLATFTLIKKWQ